VRVWLDVDIPINCKVREVVAVRYEREYEVTFKCPVFGVYDNMPSKTPKQKRTMAAAAHDPKFAKKMGIPVKVAKEFNKADQRKGKKK
jgi:hypothetical protein